MRVELVCLRRDRDAAIRLICLPPAGGSASFYHRLGSRLSQGVEVVGVQLPGRGHLVGQPPYRALGAMLADLVPAMMSLVDRPFALFGHSMGGLLAFELARGLRRVCGSSPVGLIVAACAAPQLPRTRRPVHRLPSAQLWDELSRLNGTPDEVLESTDIMELLEPAIRADFAICDSYHYVVDRPLHCPLVVFGGGADPNISRAELHAWAMHTTSSFRLSMLPGDHFFVTRELPRLVQAIEVELTHWGYRLSKGDVA